MKKVRWQIDLTPDGAELLTHLMQVGQLSTKKELIDNAVAILDWALEQATKGKSIASIDEQNKEIAELHMPILRNAARRSARLGRSEKEEISDAATATAALEI